MVISVRTLMCALVVTHLRALVRATTAMTVSRVLLTRVPAIIFRRVLTRSRRTPVSLVVRAMTMGITRRLQATTLVSGASHRLRRPLGLTRRRATFVIPRVVQV